ncbi:lactonase family protein [Auraticoccus cholistanensis]|nr:beta-propeller fold lactonase family protein [Auraticoccus cholistanensis]
MDNWRLVAEARGVLVGTLAGATGGGGVRRFGAAGSLVPALEERQGVAALLWHPTLPVLYGLTMGPEGRLFAWREEKGVVHLAADRPSHGTVPCHLAADPRGAFLLLANYGTGSLTVFPVEEDGVPAAAPAWLQALAGRGPRADRQQRSFAHHVAFMDDEVVLVNDLGGDALVSFRLDRGTGRLEQLEVSPMPAGSGPRHMVVLPDDRVVVSGELDNTVVLGHYDRASAHVTVAAVAPSSWSTEVRRPVGESLASDILAAGADVVYVANRGYDTIASLRVGADSLTPVSELAAGGSWPQHLAVVDDTLLVACQRSDAVAVWVGAAGARPRLLGTVPVERPAWLLTAPGGRGLSTWPDRR